MTFWKRIVPTVVLFSALSSATSMAQTVPQSLTERSEPLSVSADQRTGPAERMRESRWCRTKEVMDEGFVGAVIGGTIALVPAAIAALFGEPRLAMEIIVGGAAYGGVLVGYARSQFPTNCQTGPPRDAVGCFNVRVQTITFPGRAEAASFFVRHCSSEPSVTGHVSIHAIGDLPSGSGNVLMAVDTSVAGGARSRPSLHLDASERELTIRVPPTVRIIEHKKSFGDFLVTLDRRERTVPQDSQHDPAGSHGQNDTTAWSR
jgi:hypothetical protein